MKLKKEDFFYYLLMLAGFDVLVYYYRLLPSLAVVGLMAFLGMIIGLITKLF